MARAASAGPAATTRRTGLRLLALTAATAVMLLAAGVLYLGLVYHPAPSPPAQAVVSLPAAPAAPTPAPETASPPTEVAQAPPPVTTPSLAPLPPPSPLPPAPDPALVAGSALGPLPVIAPDGRQAWRVYAHPAPEGPRKPRVAILLAGLGLSAPQTQAAIQQLRGEVTLGFVPHASGLTQWLAEARAAGHEVMLQVPMEPKDSSDPGPYALLTLLTPMANVERLDWSLSRGAGYIGVLNQMGGQFLEAEADLKPVLQAVRDRGLMFLDTGTTPTSTAAKLAGPLHLPIAVADRVIDAEASRGAIDAKLVELEAIARRAGQALGVGYAYPVTIERLAQWSAGLAAKGIDLAPVSAIPTPDEKR